VKDKIIDAGSCNRLHPAMFEWPRILPLPKKPPCNPVLLTVQRFNSQTVTEVEDKIIQTILDLLNANGLTARQAKALLGRLNQLIDVGELLARRTAH
jgi:hypothetical protein